MVELVSHLPLTAALLFAVAEAAVAALEALRVMVDLAVVETALPQQGLVEPLILVAVAVVVALSAHLHLSMEVLVVRVLS
jgi:hypothetical protein